MLKITLGDLLTDRQKMNDWFETKRVSITSKERLTIEQSEGKAPFTLCAIKLKEMTSMGRTTKLKRPTGPLSEMKPEWYEIIECRETTKWNKTEEQLLVVLFSKVGVTTIDDALPAEDGSRETLKRFIARIKQSNEKHVHVRKEELEDFRSRIEDSISTMEEQGKDTSGFEERLESVESAIDSLEKGNLKEALRELEY